MMDLNFTRPAYIQTAYITDSANSVLNTTINLSDLTSQGWEANTDGSSDGVSSTDNDLVRKIALGIFFGMSILTAIGGNLLVCTAVFTERRLKRIKNNYFIVSLAVADLLVACVVMTFAMANDIQQKWMFGGVFCRIWISFDIMCSTASILNLCVISLDRYIHIQNAMYYDTWMTTRKALMFIASVWFLSALISFLPIHLGWHHSHSSQTSVENVTGISPTSTSTNESHNTNYLSDHGGGESGGGDSDDQCIIELNFIYAIVSSTISFYAPCVVMLVLYFRLFLFARRHAVSIRSMKRPAMPADLSSASSTPDRRKTLISNGSTRSSLRASDHKAAFTLGVITGVFLCCWLPFFVINPISAYNPELIHPNAFVVSTWLGYVNSCLNPIIYSIFNTEFREAFKRILCVRILRRDSWNYLPGLSASANYSTYSRTKFKKSDYATDTVNGNGTVTRKTSRDPLFNEKVTRL
ncbi:dopamine d-1 like receptor [Plakobranchus ocellatus]|uniref:Dopamine d-1 like receptor n=1 Tax=Plakobranchus ocellatus TaxID=259542 RepID=A0AAV4AYX9_9GAST|nr:dopamine d-1 like receptor [Plakobranchus ocellatus]